jgi:hypothetical protein
MRQLIRLLQFIRFNVIRFKISQITSHWLSEKSHTLSYFLAFCARAQKCPKSSISDTRTYDSSGKGQETFLTKYFSQFSHI